MDTKETQKSSSAYWSQIMHMSDGERKTRIANLNQQIKDIQGAPRLTRNQDRHAALVGYSDKTDQNIAENGEDHTLGDYDGVLEQRYKIQDSSEWWTTFNKYPEKFNLDEPGVYVAVVKAFCRMMENEEYDERAQPSLEVLKMSQIFATGPTNPDIENTIPFVIWNMKVTSGSTKDGKVEIVPSLDERRDQQIEVGLIQNEDDPIVLEVNTYGGEEGSDNSGYEGIEAGGSEYHEENNAGRDGSSGNSGYEGIEASGGEYYEENEATSNKYPGDGEYDGIEASGGKYTGDGGYEGMDAGSREEGIEAEDEGEDAGSGEEGTEAENEGEDAGSGEEGTEAENEGEDAGGGEEGREAKNEGEDASGGEEGIEAEEGSGRLEPAKPRGRSMSTRAAWNLHQY
ncbi:uncharacterized protein RCC_09498 [Ramularia collo-cygni]|uniref:Uncharacterized protein n=1 Tax=Ramularia collo-cygni TaxID=112498 RepID=A0A2D3VM54_9PEZI|nr:uncharacterized protein RCC_09498 [Ramularia collo-cygni]CZT23784.1 uncharacterized protein RCC_09498 [Ramularia collo-cygni]